MKLLDSNMFKILKSENVNYILNKQTGTMMTWGKTEDEDPIYSDVGPFIADVEISTSCSGVTTDSGVRKLCSYCYKSANKEGTYMNLETYKKVFSKFPKVLTQIAFGTDAECKANPDIWKIMEYTRSQGVIPNVTVADIDSDTAKSIAKYCGAVAVSYHNDKCLDSVYKLTSLGMKQVNIHVVLSQENLKNIVDLLDKYDRDYRIANVNAIVFLSLKQKGRGIRQTPVTNKQFSDLAEYLFTNKIRVGFDSCTGKKVLKYFQEHDMKEYETLITSCESTRESIYVSVEGKAYPCSFVTEPIFDGIDVINCNDFLQDIWYNPKIVEFRNNLLACEDSCPIYKV